MTDNTEFEVPTTHIFDGKPSHLLISFKRFYANCVRAGTIPVMHETTGKWYRSSSKEHFTKFLDKFSKEEQEYLKEGIRAPSNKSTATSRIAALLSQLREDDVALILEELK